MTGFRIDKGCAQAYWGVTPDLTTMGKVIGGGMPVGAHGGKREIMEALRLVRCTKRVPCLVTRWRWSSGIETLKILSKPGAYEEMDRKTKTLIEGILKEGGQRPRRLWENASEACLASSSAKDR